MNILAERFLISPFLTFYELFSLIPALASLELFLVIATAMAQSSESISTSPGNAPVFIKKKQSKQPASLHGYTSYWYQVCPNLDH